MGRRPRRLEPAPAAGVGRRGGLARPRAARAGSPRSVTAQHGSGGAVGAPMRRRTGRSLPDPCPTAPNRSGAGAPAPVHASLGSRSLVSGRSRRCIGGVLPSKTGVMENGARTSYHVCPLCEATCGLAIHTRGREVLGIRGDEADVFSDGFICPKG